VIGLTDDDARAARVGSGGRVVVYSGDPGEPEIDLSPLTYNWQHQIPVEIIFDDELALDAALMAIGAAIVADRQLGGLCEWLDADAPTTETILAEGGDGQRGAPLNIVASYSTTSPLT
jgi:hypothetical protein